MKNDKKALFLALLTISIWSTIASAFKLSLDHFSPVLLLFYSSGVASIVIFIITLINKRAPFKILKKNLPFSLIAGFLNPFLYYLILLKAYDILPAQSAQAINYTWGITLSIMSFIFLGQKPLKRDIAAIIICYFGVFLIANKGNMSFICKTELSGVLLALFSTLIWSAYWIINTKDSLYPEVRLFWNFFMGFIYSGLYIAFFDNFYFDIKGFSGALYIGVFEMGISFFLWLNAMKLTNNTSRISNLIYLSPIISLYIIKNIVGETILKSTIAGLMMIICGIFVQNFKRKD